MEKIIDIRENYTKVHLDQMGKDKIVSMCRNAIQNARADKEGKRLKTITRLDEKVTKYKGGIRYAAKVVVVYPEDAKKALEKFAAVQGIKVDDIDGAEVITQVIDEEANTYKVVREYTAKQLTKIAKLK